MASQHRESLKTNTQENDHVLKNMDFIPTKDSSVHQEEDTSKFAMSELNIPTQGNCSSCAKQELQNLWEMFTSWLQPEKQTKEQMIAQLVLEQFLKTGHHKDKTAMKEKWEASGRNMGRFMEGLTDDCLKPPDMVHVSMQGEEGLFPAHMALSEVITLLKSLQSSTVSTQEIAGSHLQMSPNTLLATRCEHIEDGYNNPLNLCKENSSDSSPGNEMDSIFIILKEKCPEPEQGSVSDGIPWDSRSSHQDSPRYHEVSQRASSSEAVPKEELKSETMDPMEHVEAEIIKRPEQIEHCQKCEANRTCEVHQERLHGVPKTYKCDQCPRSFKYPSILSVHQRRHKKERSFFCNKCHKGFYNLSDLNVHSVTHEGMKPFACNTCGRSFSHKTNLLAHERIHTGEKPYNCSKCNHSFRQSSTYHRHRRNCHKSD
ncbi:LOC691661 [Phodopus roborovskii]|uniref:LOC691661 protein n=1 Tax=Phodopus roborovskii TaxID=109678 RepID=A0AAV0A8D3_PHORO|nr:LOC691661 [Phodopus roborovskii]